MTQIRVVDPARTAHDGYGLDFLGCSGEVREAGREAHMSTTLTQNLRKLSGSMIRRSIRRRIVAIAVGLIILMVATSVLSMVMVGQV
ncbi:MAG TPA: hypothetical protein VMT08_25275, partial [Bradyrhizobium sp.]|nr:hypothetical protein [Bradyrhizobium sp.]